ncbi:hypothetical protein FOL46_007064 [Perkinsus olseni]|uniref:Uncharacterized protein n=1 Tax=Perkinsus olseni TaxID=32597 RepID=A0A7J6LG01_PEROL|nr:hypothetical protein FOL46_007064 [Perkinsus olseni]
MLSKGSLLMINRRCGDLTGDLRYPLDSKDADSPIDYDTHFAGSFPQFPSLQGFTDFSYKLENAEAAISWLYTGFVNKETSFMKTGNTEPRTDLSANQIFMASLCHYPMDEDETITFCWGQKERRMLSSRRLPAVRSLATLSVMVSSITEISLFVCLAFDYSLVCEATYGLTREVIERKRKGENQFKDIRARKTDLPSFDDVLGPAVRGQLTLKANALSEEQIEGMFKGVPTASVITSSPIMKASDSMLKLSVDKNGLLRIDEMTCPEAVVDEDGEESYNIQSRIFIDTPKKFVLAFPHWESGRVLKSYAIRTDGDMAKSKRLLYAGLLGDYILAKNNKSVAIEEDVQVRQFKRQRTMGSDERNATVAFIDQFMVDKICKTYKMMSKAYNHVKAEDFDENRVLFTVPDVLPKSLLNNPVGFAPPASSLEITVPNGRRMPRSGAQAALSALLSDPEMLVASKDSPGDSKVVFTRNPNNKKLMIKEASCPGLKFAAIFPAVFPDYESLTGFSKSLFEAPPGKHNSNAIRWLYIGLMRRVKEPTSSSANDIFLKELCKYGEERDAALEKRKEDERELYRDHNARSIRHEALSTCLTTLFYHT